MGRAVGLVLVFAGAGPLVGGFVFGLLWIGQVLLDPAEPWRAAYLTTPIYAALLGYLAGFAPATATGVLAALASPYLPTRWAWRGTAAAAGGVLSAVNAIVLWSSYRSSPPDAEDVIQIVVIGAVSAFVCALICEGFRSPPRRRRA